MFLPVSSFPTTSFVSSFFLLLVFPFPFSFIHFSSSFLLPDFFVLLFCLLLTLRLLPLSLFLRPPSFFPPLLLLFLTLVTLRSFSFIHTNIHPSQFSHMFLSFPSCSSFSSFSFYFKFFLPCRLSSFLPSLFLPSASSPSPSLSPPLFLLFSPFPHLSLFLLLHVYPPFPLPSKIFLFYFFT